MLLPDCPAPAPCFAPVTTQAAVLSLLGQAKPNAAGWILGWNYEPSRLTCGNNTYGFNCPNFENQDQATALQQLNKLQPNTPTLITSESGHIVYVNSAALQQLNICGMTACPTTVRRH
jgi:predicted amidohydrolase YtcJ